MLAKHLNISLTTVEHAYEQLAAEGYLLSKPRKAGMRPKRKETLHRLHLLLPKKKWKNMRRRRT